MLFAGTSIYSELKCSPQSHFIMALASY
jgi:hypothetical protein